MVHVGGGCPNGGGPAGDSAVVTGCAGIISGGGKEAGSGGGGSAGAEPPSIGAGKPGEPVGNGIRWADNCSSSSTSLG